MKQKLEGLDFIRAAACISILLMHMHLTVMAYISVAAFFALSGFLLTYNALGREETEPPTLKGSVAFALKRTRKLYVLYLITLIFPLLEQVYGIATGLGKLDGLLIMRVITNVLLLQSIVPDMNTCFFLNGIAWYLSTSMFLYLAFPYILHRLRKLRSKRTAWCVIIVTFLLQTAGGYFVSELAEKLLPAAYVKNAEFTKWLTYVSPFYRIGDFIIACNFAYLFRNRRKDRRSVGTATFFELAALAFAAATELLFETGTVPKYLCFTVIYIPAVSLLIWEFARGEGYITRAMDNPVVHFISDLSPYIYLIHFVMILAMTIIINRLPLSFGVRKFMYVTLIPTAVILCSMAYRAIEKKIRSRRTA